MQEEFMTRKRSDKEMVELLSTFDPTPSSITLTTIDDENHVDLSKLESVLNENVSVVKQFAMTLPNNISITVVRKESEFWDDVTVKLAGIQNNQINASHRAAFLATVVQAKNSLREISQRSDISALLGKNVSDHFLTREVELGKLEDLQIQLLRRLDEYAIDLKTKSDAKEATRDSELEAKLGELESEFQQRKSKLDEREQELEERRQAVNDRESKFERRQTIKDLIENLDSSNKDFEFRLTPATRHLRNSVHWIAIAIIGVFALLLVSSLKSGIPSDSQTNDIVWHYVKAGSALLGLLIASGTYARWMGSWADKHANEEFRLKRMLLDVRRANLLIETALEWRQENQEEAIPQEILDALSKRLFEEEYRHVQDTPPVETIATAMLGSAASLNLKLGDNEIGFDRRGIKQMRKPVKPSDDK